MPRTTRTVPTLLAGLGLLALTACASAPEAAERETREGADPNVVTSDDIDRRTRGEPIEAVLEGRVPGVRIVRLPGGNIAVRIRGTTSINATNEPLYVVDGVPIEPGPGGALAGIQVSEISSIEVLKDPAETSMYGVRGANGVVLVYLKKPGEGH